MGQETCFSHSEQDLIGDSRELPHSLFLMPDFRMGSPTIVAALPSLKHAAEGGTYENSKLVFSNL